MTFSRTPRLALMLLAVLAIVSFRPAHAQIQDGGFEQPASSTTVTYHAGDTFGAWHVAAGSVDTIPATVWQPEEGSQSLDLSGDTAGTIYQDVPTIAQQTYRLSFYLAGNPFDQPSIKSLNVLADNTQIGNFTFDTTNTSPTNMGWRLIFVTFTATSDVTRLSFQSLNNSADGPALDNISLSRVLPPTHVLWTNTNGQASIWNYGPVSGGYSHIEYGPFGTWTAKAIADGSDGKTRVLWTDISGQISLWNLDNSTGVYSHAEYGPFGNWTAKTISLTPHNTAHVLWTNTNGQASIWNYDTTTGSYTHIEYGPFGSWTAQAIADGGTDGKTRVLWTNPSGQMSLWGLDNSTGVYSHAEYGPFGNWTAKTISVGADNTTHVLWANTNGQISIWNDDISTGNYTNREYGPFATWSAQALTDSADGKTEVMWNKTDGTMSFWGLNNTTGIYSHAEYGPFPGLTALALSAGP